MEKQKNKEKMLSVAKDNVRELRSVTYKPDTAQWLVDRIMKEVKEKNYNWEDLGSSEQELKKLVSIAKKEEASDDLQNLRSGIHGHDVALNIAKNIKEWIKNGDFTWEDINSSEKELKDLVSQARN